MGVWPLADLAAINATSDAQQWCPREARPIMAVAFDWLFAAKRDPLAAASWRNPARAGGSQSAPEPAGRTALPSDTKYCPSCGE